MVETSDITQINVPQGDRACGTMLSPTQLAKVPDPQELHILAEVSWPRPAWLKIPQLLMVGPERGVFSEVVAGPVAMLGQGCGRRTLRQPPNILTSDVHMSVYSPCLAWQYL